MRIGFWLLIGAGTALAVCGAGCLHMAYSIGLLAVPLHPPMDAIAYARGEMYFLSFFGFWAQAVLFFVLAFMK